MKKLVLLVLLGFLLSCNKKQQTNNATILKPYIISEEKRKLIKYEDSLKKSGSGLIVIPRQGYYSGSNLIIDTQGDFYYYQKNYSFHICGYGMENDTLPEFLNLEPKNIFKIPKESIERFIDENVMTKEPKSQILVIASQKDTLADKSFLKFYYNLKVPTYLIRRTTQEEDTVLHYKVNYKTYFPESIKWDKKRIQLKN